MDYLNNFTVVYLKDRPEYINEIAELMFMQWGHLRSSSNIVKYRNALASRLNLTSIPLTILSLSENGVLLGFASLVEFDMDTHKQESPWISGVFVKQEQRGVGIGRRLVNKLEEVAAQMNHQKLYLFTFDKEVFYLRMKWSILKKENYLNKNVTIMTKLLNRF